MPGLILYLLLSHTRFFSIITEYDVRFIVMDGSVSLHLLFPQYGYFAFNNYFYSF